MSRYRTALPQLQGGLFLTDGGLETTLLFHEQQDLPCFAAFPLLDRHDGRQTLLRYFGAYAALARTAGCGLVLETPTWRANPDWAERLGYSAQALDSIQQRSVELLLAVRDAHEVTACPIVISGNLGPRGDGYRADRRMTADESAAYHAPQIEAFASTAADMVAAFTMTYPEEAIGIVRGARAAGMPVAISFTVETDGRLPSGTSLQEAIEATDRASDGYPVYYMINCAHPAHFRGVLAGTGGWRRRVRGLRANASRRSHAELDAAPDLDMGDPVELAADYRQLRVLLPDLNVMGGCCGTDQRHVAAISAALRSA